MDDHNEPMLGVNSSTNYMSYDRIQIQNTPFPDTSSSVQRQTYSECVSVLKLFVGARSHDVSSIESVVAACSITTYEI